MGGLKIAPAADATVEELLDGWGLLWGIKDLAARVKVIYSPRMRRSLGSCNAEQGIIRLNPDLAGPAASMLPETLCHEAAHYAVCLLHGNEPKPHGGEWAGLMRMASYEPRARTKVPEGIKMRPPRSRRRYLYKHRCVECGATRVARRVVRSWRCRPCLDRGAEGRLEVVRLGGNFV